VNKNNILCAVAGLFAGLVMSFIVTNAVSRSADVDSRADDVRSRLDKQGANSTLTDASTKEDSAASLTEDEIRGAIAKADARADDISLQRDFALALYQYSRQTGATQYLPDIARFLKRVYEKNPKDHDTTVTLASVLFDIGQSSAPESFSDARKYYLKALEIKPDDVDARTGLGLTYYLGHPSNPQRAITEYRKSLAIAPRHEATLQNLASALISTGNLQEAQKIIAELEDLNPSNTSLANLRAQLAQNKNASQE
jgi:tetratricopeptide (TPR) repeat protein